MACSTPWKLTHTRCPRSPASRSNSAHSCRRDHRSNPPAAAAAHCVHPTGTACWCIAADHSPGSRYGPAHGWYQSPKDPLLRARNPPGAGPGSCSTQSATCRPAVGAGCCGAARLPAQYGSIHGPNGHPAGSQQTQSGHLTSSKFRCHDTIAPFISA